LNPQEPVDARMDARLGILLRTGVMLSASIVLIGGVLFLFRHGSSPPDYYKFHGEPPELRNIGGIWHEALTFQARGIIQLGLLLLIATPVARVIFSIIAFAIEKDWKYVVITMIVLGLLVYSLFANPFA
jgi:uncharacterized membrane protein